MAPKQFLERMTTVTSGGLQLEALFHEGLPRLNPCLIAPPHPAFGGSMDSPVCSELAWAVSRSGRATLRFNYRGVGGSQGKDHVTTPMALEEREDLSAAATHLGETARSSRVHVAGYSFGAWLAADLAIHAPVRMDRLVLVSPPTRFMPFDFAALSRSKVPVLILAGADDSYLDWALLDEARSLPNLVVTRLAGADHFFMKGLVDVGRASASFLAEGDRGELELPEGPDLELER